ncbi:MAG: hypothetical protein DMG64_11945 [Acidobacteria bacterium]|nr:MAG: hypothetical protein DMG63_06485 [Acidobacteriota bacterium]PYY02341.1 MAG: hypothetical protein DMG64_11945 [Acidobacteriota bacterium]PYY23199.1 MAG: hypothetical protein DMG62_08850 [Acidobacteriota bacterium]
MPVLPYCIVLRDSGISTPKTGVLNSGIHQMSEGNLRGLYSELLRSEISPRIFQQAALEFHKVVHAVFDETAVVPFRFPTWLTPAELSRHLQQESQRYTTFLNNHAKHTQMEVRLTSSTTSPTNAISGTAHLRARAAESWQLRNTAEELKNLLSSEVIEWRERDTSQGMRLYALIDRANVTSFRERLGKREHDTSLRWSGPWPATEFLEAPRRSEP